jgi:hypothetical protein
MLCGHMDGAGLISYDVLVHMCRAGKSGDNRCASDGSICGMCVDDMHQRGIRPQLYIHR